MGFLLGIDIGGTKIEAAVLQFSLEQKVGPVEWSIKNKAFSGRIIGRERIKTQRQEGYEQALRQIGRAHV